MWFSEDKMTVKRSGINPGVTEKLIILNGPSSAGKSSIAHRLQNLARAPFIHFCMDDFLKGCEQSPDPALAIKNMAEHVEGLVHAGKNVIVDCVAFPKAMKIWLDVLQKHTPVLVAVSAPLPVLEAREKQRSDREPGMAGEQYDRLFLDTDYHLKIDTSVMTSEDAAFFILTNMASEDRYKAPPRFEPRP